jgi:hypothetical protein
MSRQTNRFKLRWTLVVALLAMVGCGAENPALVPVTGIVTMDGEPLPEVAVTFTPTGETLGNGAIGGTNGEGRFTLIDIRGSTGLHPGEYKVSFYPTPSGKNASDPTDVVASGGVGLPGIVMDPNNTPIRATVPASGGDVRIALTPSGEDSTVIVKPAAAGG